MENTYLDGNNRDTQDPFRGLSGKRRTHLVPLVLLGGLITSFLTLAVIYFVSRKMETDVLSIILNFLPIPSAIFGVLAGSGYAIACRMTQFRASVALIFFIFVVQIGVFIGG
ncbi:MAG: hypothetical protein Q4G69_13150 [Planctomycetia bacterium]|nr:hypothetical protein [Planctomycetia bacterium]